MIRGLAETDLPSVRELLRATNNFNPAELAIADELMGIVISQPAQQDYLAFVADKGAESGSRVAGFLIIGPTPATLGTWHMYWIAVHPVFCGTGIAASLQEHAENIVRSRGGYWLLAETSGQPAYQRTRGFYIKHGYQQLVRIPDYYRPSDDLIIYGKRLSAETSHESGKPNEVPSSIANRSTAG